MSNYVARNNINVLNTTPTQLSNISAVLYSNSSFVPLVNRKYTLQLSKGEILEGKTDQEGYLQHLDIPAGDYDLVIDRVEWTIPTVADPDERLPIRVKEYYLVPKDDEQGEEDESDYEEGGFAVIPDDNRVVIDENGYRVTGQRNYSVEDEEGFDLDSEVVSEQQQDEQDVDEGQGEGDDEDEAAPAETDSWEDLEVVEDE